MKAAYSLEANAELAEYTKSKAHYISLGGLNVRTSSKEAIQSIYNMTLILSTTKVTQPIF